MSKKIIEDPEFENIDLDEVTADLGSLPNLALNLLANMEKLGKVSKTQTPQSLIKHYVQLLTYLKSFDIYAKSPGALDKMVGQTDAKTGEVLTAELIGQIKAAKLSFYKELQENAKAYYSNPKMNQDNKQLILDEINKVIVLLKFFIFDIKGEKLGKDETIAYASKIAPPTTPAKSP